MVEGKKNCLELVNAILKWYVYAQPIQITLILLDAIQITAKEASRISHLKTQVLS